MDKIMFTQEINEILYDFDPVGLIWSDDQQDEYWSVADFIQRENFNGEVINTKLIERALVECFEVDVEDIDLDALHDAANQIKILPIE